MSSAHEAQSMTNALKGYVATYPDVDALVSEGKLVDKGRGWYEVADSGILEWVQRYMAAAPKVVNNKARIKLRKMKPSLRARIDRL
ncbi:hypothetical protein [Comamonas terrigena]|uniref:hypothetical protein n=1 Tax=Comamonas terrigena TaxID=32013 RepID=UPI0028AEC33A|nr:hypothetical protein [Comamonas terrigena]